ncbi:MAG: thiamine phosphate synthase [Terrimicrobiaceae bacterium]
MNAKLYGILDLGYVSADQALPTAAKMLEGGVGILQLRAKGHPPQQLLPLAAALRALCQSANVPFIVNDHPQLAKACGAHGVHVGQDDLSVAETRTLAGPGMMVGKSTHSLAQAIAAMDERPDYLGFGPLFATATKPDYVPVGLSDIHAVHEAVSLPVFCIGGIKRENLPEVIAAGARRVVIVSGILLAPEIASYCRDCLELLNRVAD